MALHTLTHLPLCGHCEDGWIVDEVTLLPVSKCPCRTARPNPGPQVAADAHPQAYQAALRIIRDAASTGREFSANALRDRLNTAQVPGPVVGAAFAHLVRVGEIQQTGQRVPSTDPGTHGHRIAMYKAVTR